jgi:hypothetical protein
MIDDVFEEVWNVKWQEKPKYSEKPAPYYFFHHKSHIN